MKDKVREKSRRDLQRVSLKFISAFGRGTERIKAFFKATQEGKKAASFN